MTDKQLNVWSTFNGGLVLKGMPSELPLFIPKSLGSLLVG